MLMNPFEMDGPNFLVLYFICIVIASVIAIVFRVVLSSMNFRDRKDSLPELDPWQLAYLRGGSRAVAHTPIIDLAAKQLIVGDLATGRFAANRAVDQLRLDAIPSAIYRSSQMGDGLRAERAAGTIAYECEKIKQGLEESGVLQSLDQRVGQVWPGILAFAAVLFFGIARLAIGIYRDKPVGYLLLLLVFAAVAAILLNYTSRLSQLGKLALEKQTTKLRDTRFQNRVADGESQPLDASDPLLLYAIHPLAIGFAADGFGGLHDDEFLDFNTRKLTERMQATNNMGGDSGGSGCSGGDFGADAGASGCSGGGCGGGGCGGCGS